MKLKILSSFIISLFIISPTLALTVDDVELLYQAGFISEDQLPLALSAATQQTTTTNTQTKFIYGAKTSSNSSSCLKLTSDISNGMSGNNVTALQNFLKSKGHFSAEATGYYGAITQKAVELFQKAEGIVLNGTPETTGFGAVGPTTRSVIEKLTCDGTTSSNNNFFGYNLDELFNTPVDINYDIDFNTDIAFNTDIDFNTEIDFKEFDFGEFEPVEFEDYDIRFDDIDFNTSITGYNTAIDGVGVLLYAKAVNGEYMRGGTSSPVAVRTSAVELIWDSNDTKDCVLTGDFKEKRLSIPTNGTANLTMRSATGGTYGNGDPIYQFRVSCNASTTNAYALPTSDTIKLWIYRATQ